MHVHKWPQTHIQAKSSKGACKWCIFFKIHFQAINVIIHNQDHKIWLWNYYFFLLGHIGASWVNAILWWKRKMKVETNSKPYFCCLALKRLLYPSRFAQISSTNMTQRKQGSYSVSFFSFGWFGILQPFLCCSCLSQNMTALTFLEVILLVLL